MPELTVEQLREKSARALKDIDAPTAIVSETGSFGVSLCVLIPFEMYQEWLSIIVEAEHQADTFFARIRERSNA